MFTSLVPRIAGDDEPPDASRHRLGRRRLGAVLAVVSALAMGFAMMSAPQPAEALTAIDGQWTVVHGGTGQISLNSDGTYSSTCEVNPDYEDAWCPPAPSGTFQYSTQSTASVTFNGADGSTNSYRVSGLVSSPDTITSYFGSRTYSPLVMKRGTEFLCTDWGGSYSFKGTPLAEYDAASGLLYATGSHELITGATLAETAPNYFQNGNCDAYAPVLHVDSVIDVSVLADPGTWAPKATVTIKDQAGAAVSDATVTGGSTWGGGVSTCVTVADGTCTISAVDLAESVTWTRFDAYLVEKSGSLFDGNVVTLMLYVPGTTAPEPLTHHVVDLDDVTTVSSGGWQPQVAVTVRDSIGLDVAGATVSGTFSGQIGTVTCTTGAYGECILVGDSLKNKVKSAVFTVTNVVAASSAYAATANIDVEGDSDGTSITINRP
jgi:hypothetical protein